MAKKLARTDTERLIDFYALGRWVLKAGSGSVNPRTGRLARGSFAAICETKQRNRNELSKARRFARLYDSHELRTLCSLGNKEGQQPITKSHVCRLVVVDDRTVRGKLARDCAKYSWTVQRLELEIQRVQKKRKYGGRTPKRPETRYEMLGETERLANRLIHWVQILQKADKATGKGGVPKVRKLRSMHSKRKIITLSEFPSPMRSQLIAITEEAKELANSLRKRLESRQLRRRKKRSKRI